MKSKESETQSKQDLEAKSLLASIVESSDDAIIGKTLDGTILSWNSGAQKMYGYIADEVKGRSISILIPPDKTDEVPQLLQRIRKGQRIEHYETVRMRKDGKQINISLTISPIKDSTGKTIGASTIARDITERKRAEEELQRAHDELEIRVRERTAELEEANIELEAEIAGRKRAEKASRQSEGRLRLLSDLTMEGIVIHDKGIILDANEALALMFDYGNVSEIIGKSGFDLMTPESQQLLQRHIATGSDKPYEAVGIKKDGMHFPIEIHGSNIKYKGKIVRTGVVRDLTERKRAEEVLRESEERLRLAVEAGNFGTWELDLVTGQAIRSLRHDQIFGYAELQPEWSLEKGLQHILPEDRQKVQDAHTPAPGKTNMYIEARFRRANDGAIRWLMSYGRFYYDDQGRPIRIVGIFADITERKWAEEALMESEQRWATTLASIGDAVISTDVEGRIAFMNAEAEALTGWTLAEASTKPVTEVFNIINEYTRQEADNPVTRVLQEGTIVGLANHTILIKRDGTEVPIDDSGAPIRDGDGKTMGVVLVFRDITERKLAEKALQERESILHSFFDSSGVMRGIVEVIAEDDVRHITDNAVTAAFIGLTPDAMKNKCGSELGEPRDILRMWVSHYIESQQSGKPVTFEYMDKRGDIDAWLQTTVSYLGTPLHGYPRFAYVILDITERKKTEEALQQSNRNFMALFNNRTVGLAYCKTTFDEHNCPVDYIILDINQTYEIMTGIRREQIVGKKITEALPGVSQDLIDRHNRVAVTGEESNFEIYDPVTTRWYEVNVFSPQQGYFVALFNNITERKRAEEALRESEERYRSVITDMSEGLMIFDEKGNVTFQNPASLRIHGFKPQEKGRIQHENLPVEWKGWDEAGRSLPFEEWPIARVALRHEHVQNQMLHALRVDTGHEFDASYNGAPIYDAQGLFAFGFITIQDITERKQAEEALRKAHDELEHRVQERTAQLSEANKTLLTEIAERKQAEEKIREQATLLDNAQEAVGVRSLEHNLIYWNKGAQRLYGFSAEEAIGKNPVEFLFKDKEEPPQLIEAKRSVLEKGEWTGELHQVTKDSREVTVESHWTLIYDNEGKPKSILVVNTDITEKKMFESHLLRAQRMESIGILAGGIAHNLNNMLTPMMMSLHMLKQKFTDEQSQKLLTILEQNSQHSADLIKQVLSFSRGVEGERNSLHVANIVFEVEKIAKETFPRNIEIRTDMPIDIWTISGDATQLHQVIMNLCVNARDAMPDGGILNIKASNFLVDENYVRIHTEAKVGSYVAISVSDTGIGIPPKILDRIFEPFFTTKEFGKGTGLGLSTALAIVKSHGGFINVYSEVGKGTTFRVYLPAIKTEMQIVEEQQLELFTGHGELVLVAEDEDSVREITTSTLEKYGYKVLAANDGADAVALYAQNKDKIKIVLMDMMMPVMDGEASIRAIRIINPEVKIIVVSGLAEKDKLAKIESTRAQALLPKPYTAERLLKAMHEVLSAK